MGELTGGPFYDLIGKTGNNVGRKVRGKNTFSMAPPKRKKPGTVNQQAWENFMKLMFAMVKSLKALVEVGFSTYTDRMSASNAALQYNAKNAVMGVAPNYSIDYAKLMYSKGTTVAPDFGTVEAIAGGKVDIGWEMPVNTSFALSTDMAYFMAYCAQADRYAIVEAAVPRSALTYQMKLPQIFVGKEAHVYMSFVSVLGKPGNSVYLGVVEVV